MRLADFTGDWTIAREIDDLHAGRRGRLHGRARFAPAAGGLAYREAGTLELDGAAPMAATRVLLWREAGGTVEIYFEDGRPFHGFPAGSDAPEAEHLCGSDLYRVRYDFSGWPDWKTQWRVRGQRKNYLMETRYRRE